MVRADDNELMMITIYAIATLERLIGYISILIIHFLHDLSLKANINYIILALTTFY